MTLTEMRAEVYRRLRESTDSPTMWTDADINQALQEAYQELADACEFHEKWQRIELLADRPYYDLRHLTRDEFLVAGPVFNETTNRWMIPTTPSDLDVTDLRWEERIAEPERFMVRGLWWLGYWPVTSAPGGSLKQYYVGLPDALEDDDAPAIHTAYHYALVEYALWDLFAQDGEVDLAWASWKEYLGYELRLDAF